MVRFGSVVVGLLGLGTCLGAAPAVAAPRATTASPPAAAPPPPAAAWAAAPAPAPAPGAAPATGAAPAAAPQQATPPPGYAPGPPPPAYGYPPPQQGAWGYAPPREGGQYTWQGPPATLPYREDQPIPPGYRYTEQQRTGLVVAGAITLGIPYVIGLSVASSGGLDNGTGWLVVPALGPWMAIAARKNSCANGTVNYDAGSCVGDVFAKMGLIFDGIVQLTGTTLLVVGLAVPKKVLVRQDIAHLTLMPVGSGYGLGARGSF